MASLAHAPAPPAPPLLPHVASTIRRVLTEIPAADARTTGFCVRRSPLAAAVFVPALVFGWWQRPRATLAELSQTAAALGAPVSPQALAQRFTPAAAALLRTRVEAAAAAVVAADPVAVAVLGRFAAVEVLDSTTVGLPDDLAATWRGCGGRAGHGAEAALKVTVRLDLVSGRLRGPELSAGRTQDRATAAQHAPVGAGALRVADQGFAGLGVYADIAAEGAWFLSRLPVHWGLRRPDGRRLDLHAWLAAPGWPRSRSRRRSSPSCWASPPACRPGCWRAGCPPTWPRGADVAEGRRRALRAAAKRAGRTPTAAALERADWTLLVTNAPAALLSPAEASAVLRARWQVELLFKRWKSQAGLATGRSVNPHRVLCEVYAKLLVVLAQHWVLLTGCWQRPDRSLAAATTVVQAYGLPLALQLRDPAGLLATLTVLARVLASCRPITRRRAAPATYQVLTDPSLGWGSQGLA